MAWNRELFLERVLAGYVQSHDIERLDPQQDAHHLAAKAELHVTQTSYAVIKKAEMWRADSDEYAYIISVPHLTEAIVQDAIDFAYAEGMARIEEDLKVQKNHMCTRITAVFVCDEADEEAMNRVAGCRLYKSFQFSLKGWMEFHAVAVDLGKESVTGNRYGKPTADYLKSVMNPQVRKKRRKFLGVFPR